MAKCALEGLAQSRCVAKLTAAARLWLRQAFECTRVISVNSSRVYIGVHRLCLRSDRTFEVLARALLIDGRDVAWLTHTTSHMSWSVVTSVFELEHAYEAVWLHYQEVLTQFVPGLQDLLGFESVRKAKPKPEPSPEPGAAAAAAPADDGAQ
jgi:hypothetical protein